MKALNRVLALLKTDPSLKLIIEGHTDSKGAKEYNRRLSQQRIQTVMEWLKSHGIDEKRLEAKDYGDSMPIADNNNPKGRALNRRVEIVKKILKPPGKIQEAVKPKTAVPDEPLETPLAFFPVNKYEFEPVVDGTHVLKDFILQNKGTAELKVERVKTG